MSSPSGSTIVGTAGADVHRSRTVPGQPLPTSAPDVITGLGGHDSLSGEGGNDAIDGGDGNDALAGGAVSTGNLHYDADGSGPGARVLFAKLAAGVAVTATDFTIVD